MTFSSAHKRLLGFGSVAVLSLGLAVGVKSHKATLTLPNNQLLTEANVQQGITDGTYIATGNCTLSGNQVMREADMNYCIKTKSGCFTNTNQLPTYAQTASCLATPTPAPTSSGTPTPTPTATPTPTSAPSGSTTIPQATDPWLTDGNTYWPNLTGSASFQANNSTPGAPSNGQEVYGSATIYQSLDSGSTINAGTTIYVAAYLENGVGSALYEPSGCVGTTTATATGSAKLEILNSSNAVVASVNATTSSLASYTITYTAPSSGVYKEAVVVSYSTTNYTPYHSDVHGACIPATATSVTGYGYGTRITAGN